ncbi:MAG: hypothetical protein NT141_00195 [candidate division WWE3 bacterium]|nr:hypothetical protein [candidate division WWE3 bacterium]
MKLNFKIHKKLILESVISWVPLAFVATAAIVGAYCSVQQNFRQSANDPQVQLSQDIAGLIAQGADPASYDQAQKIDVAQSLTPFLIITDESGKVLASSITVSGKSPVVPSGVLSFAKSHADDRVTWQPLPKVRMAIVVKYYKGQSSSGFVIIGRSLKEIETRTDNLMKLMAGGLALTLIGSLTLVVASKVTNEQLSFRA